jgi:serine/threonine protein kinase
MLSPGVVLQQRYRIKRLLARGGMGAVYEAEAVHLRNVVVAVKETLYNEDRKHMREQFEREAATLARLRHPALPQVKDHFIEGSGQFLVMDYIEGSDLGDLLGQRISKKGEPFEIQQVIEWGERLLDALVYIHGQYPPVIHRDIKPQNLKLTPGGELFLIDFGLAKDATTPTRPGHSVRAYTLEYAPPEQIKGEKTDARSDLYSLGATLYALATCKLPPDARVREESVRHLMPDLLQPAHRINSHVPFAFAVTLAKSMALDRKQRYQSAKQMLEALRQIKLAIEAEIAERERQEEETRQRKASRRRQSKDSARQPSESAERAEKAEPAKKAKRAVVAEVAPIERQQEEKPKSPEKESRQRKTGQQRQRKAAARQPSERAERAEKAERSKRAKKAVAAGVAEREQLDEESRRHEEVARMATVLDEVGNRQEDPAIMALALPHDADTRLITRQTVTIEQPIDQEDAASEPEPAEPPARRKTLRAALGKIAANLLVALVAYLLWNITLVVYLLWSFSRAHR